MEISRARLLLSISIGILAISCASVLIRLAQGEGVPSLSIAAWRMIVASGIMLPYAWATERGEIRGLSRREWQLLLAAGMFLGLHFAAWIASLRYTSVASSVVLVSMGPVFVALGSWFFLRERPNLVMAAGIALAAIGSVVISWGDLSQGTDHLLGDLLALTGAMMVAAYLMIGRKVRARRSLATYVAPVYGAAMVSLLTLTLVGGQPLFGFGPVAFGYLLALGLVPQLIGHSTLNWALRHLSATFVSIVTLAEPIGSGILAYLILDEEVTLATAIGGILVLGGIYVASRGELGTKRLPAQDNQTGVASRE